MVASDGLRGGAGNVRRSLHVTDGVAYEHSSKMACPRGRDFGCTRVQLDGY